jgi:beta-glucosidase
VICETIRSTLYESYAAFFIRESIQFFYYFVKTFSQLTDSSDATLCEALGENFVLGAATSAYQIEGAVNAGGRGASIWDTFSRTPGKTVNGETGDVACDHYHRWQSDVDLMSDLRLDAYRFSIAWTRVQPNGSGSWNDIGIAFYDRLVDRLLEKGIAAHATLYHWDLPQALQDKGGWASRETAVRFADYAEKMAEVLGDRLTTLCTHNEPFCTATLGHETGKFAPGYKDPALAAQVSHHLLLSHGLAMAKMRAVAPKCALGIVLNQSPITPATNSPEDLAAAKHQHESFVGWYMDPIFRGEYPSNPGIHHYPTIESGDMDLIRAPIDFLGINYYTRIWCSASNPPIPTPNELGVTDMGWEIYPQGLEELLVANHERYRLPPIYIHENGIALPDRLSNDGVDDPQRIDYVRRHLAAVANARRKGVDVRGYFYWTLFDNYEWDSGYAKRFGLVYVDYPTQRRIAKRSAQWYRDLILQKRQLSQANSLVG